MCAKRDKGYDSGYDSLVVHIERHGKKYEMAGKAVAQAVETEIQEEERRYQKQESEIWCRRHEFFHGPCRRQDIQEGYDCEVSVGIEIERMADNGKQSPDPFGTGIDHYFHCA